MSAALASEPLQPEEVPLAWPPPPKQVDLEVQHIHVWSAWIFQPTFDYASSRHKLSESERERSELFHFERDRRNFIVRRSWLRSVLGHYLKKEPSHIQLAYGAHGKPRLLDPDGAHPLHFNFSHSRNLAVCAVCRGAALGVDVEKIRPMPEMNEIAASFFSSEENERLNSTTAERRLEVFFSSWTRKEAYLKATGEGISGALSQIDCCKAPPPWSLHTFVPAPGFIGAVAANGGGRVHCWQWRGA